MPKNERDERDREKLLSYGLSRAAVDKILSIEPRALLGLGNVLVFRSLDLAPSEPMSPAQERILNNAVRNMNAIG